MLQLVLSFALYSSSLVLNVSFSSYGESALAFEQKGKRRSSPYAYRVRDKPLTSYGSLRLAQASVDVSYRSAVFQLSYLARSALSRSRFDRRLSNKMSCTTLSQGKHGAKLLKKKESEERIGKIFSNCQEKHFGRSRSIHHHATSRGILQP